MSDKYFGSSIMPSMDIKNTEKYDIIIAGAGMVGLTMAVALAKAGVSVAVIEKTSLPEQLEEKFDGRVSAISLGSQQILDAAGAWEYMREYAEPILDIRVTDGNTPIFLHYDHREVGDAPFGYIIENRYTRYGLQQAASKLGNLKIIDKFTTIKLLQDTDSASVVGAEGRTLSARLLIAADGRGSDLREMAGIKTIGWNYKQTAIVCTIEHELPHKGLAHERFLPIGPFAVLPMQGNRSSLVWVEPETSVKIYMELPEEEFVQEISERIGDYLGKIKTIGGRFSYPLSLLHAKKYTAKRLVLIGDAAHGMHPIAGQGVNLGFRDVAVLRDLILEKYALGLDIGGDGLLADYARLRKFDNISMLAVMDILNRLFSNNILPIRAARDAGLWAVGRMPELKKMFMRHAMGIKKSG